LISKVGIVVPTLGERPDKLIRCLKSIRTAGDAHILLVAPASVVVAPLLQSGLIDSVVIDEKLGLPTAINQGISRLPDSIQYVNWLGDDDQLTPTSITTVSRILDSESKIVMLFGACDYINNAGDVLWTNRSGQWAVPVLRFGPNLIPQPGALFRRSAFASVGGLKTNLGLAFDFDLIIRLRKIGRIKYINQTLAQFGWHTESLSVKERKKSVAEASQIRISHLPAGLRAISFIWEYPVQQATNVAGKLLTLRAQRKGLSE
jgi:GT2 family glycosyltransferase